MKNLLIVEDQPDLLEVVQDYVQSQFPNINVIPCVDYNEALTAVSEHDISLMLTDLCLGPKSGYDLIESLPDRKFPIYITTGFMDLEEKDWKSKGVNGVLVKPYDFTFLLNLIQEELGD